MSRMTRRQMLQMLGAAGAASALSFTVPVLGAVSRAETQTIGRVTRYTRGDLTVHTYIAPDASASVTAHIFETPDRLLIVDAQLVQTFARDFKAYADSLGKPIDRVLLSHAHPDHFLGGNVFEGVPFVTTAAIAGEVETYIASGGVAGAAGLIGESEVPSQARVPDGSLSTGELAVDGVSYLISNVVNTEAPNALIVRVPQMGVVVVQDLLFNGSHFAPGVDRANWIAELEALRASMVEGYDTLLVGHGLPATQGLIDVSVQYLRFVEETIASGAGAAALAEALLARYPGYEARFLLSFWRGVLGD